MELGQSVKLGQIKNEIGMSMLYSKRFLKETTQNANYFLKSIAYDVQVKKLLSVVKTCTYHSEMTYCPVLLQICHDDLKQIFGGEYLLQVYNLQGTCVFDKVLKYDIVSWNIFFNYFVFKLDDNEDGGGWFYIVQFNEDGSIQVSKVKDIFNDKSFCHIGLSQQNLFLANDHEVNIISFKNANKSQEVNEIIPKPGQFSNLKLEKNNRLHGFFENADSLKNNFLLMTIENSQNVMTFAKLTFAAGEETASNIQIHQYREVVNIEKAGFTSDSIDNFKFYINGKDDKEKFVGVARKLSGLVDFFYNYEHIDTTTELYERVELTTRYIYLQMKNAQATDNQNDDEVKDSEIPVIEIDQAAAQRIGESVGDTIKLDPTKWDHINFDKIRNHARIFSAITLININFFIAFNKIVAVSDVVTQQWKFYSFMNTVSGLLRNQSLTNAHDMNVGVLLENGDIKMIDRESELEDWKVAEKGLKIQGRILKVVSDWRDISSHYILAKQSSGKRALFGFQKNVITELDKSVEMKDDEELLRCITPNEKEDFLLMSKKSLMIRTFTNTARGKGDVMNVALYRKIKIVEIANADPEIKTNFQKLGNYDFHTAVGSQSHDHILLFNKFDVIKCTIQKKEQSTKDKKEGVSHKIYDIEEKLDYNIQNLQVIDGDYCYSLSNESSNQGRPGFYIQNISSFINAGTNQTGNFRLKAATVGQNDLLDYYKDDQRLAYISSYDCIRIVPLLHRSTLGFIGMRPRKEYLGFRKYQDKIMALDKRGNITTWSVLTGKVDNKSKMTVSMIESKQDAYANYEIYRNGPADITYRSEWYQRHILLVDKKNPVTDVDQVRFFDGRINSELGADTSYVSTLEKKFFRFRVIEIMDTQEVKEHFSFVHPYYGDDKYQRLFFSEDLDLMLERQDQNVFLYKPQNKAPQTAMGINSKEITWTLVKRIKRFPMDLASVTFVNYLFSPNLRYYLDFNKKDKMFVIKDTFTQFDKCKIPNGLMHPGNGKDIMLIGKKFKWISNSLIKVINNDGIEKTVDITKDCDQIYYCSVPMLDINSLRKEDSSHFFYDISITKENQTIDRLKRKYQQYFAAVCSGQTDKQELYNILFNVDFNIDNCKGKLVSDTSFTYFHLKIAELMEVMPKFNLKRYHPEEVKILALNIFPHGKTVLHYAFQNLNIVRRFYKVIESEVAKAKELASSNDQDVTNQGFFEIPFLKTFSAGDDDESMIGQTPLHLCMKSGNFKSADIILQKLCNDSIDSHARSINDIIPQLVEEELPSLGKYLDSRFGQTSLLQEHTFKRGCIRKFEDLDHGITTSELWPDKHALRKKLFDKAEGTEKEKPEAECKVEYLDIVGLHCYTEEVGSEFFDALAGSGDLSLFSYRSVQSIIDFKWPLAREYTMKVLFFPFCIYLAIFVAWSNAFNQFTYQFNKESSYVMWIVDKVLAALLYFFSVYFLTNELRQMYHSGIGYFKQIWNYCDFLPSSLIIAIVSIKLRAQFYTDPKDNIINDSVLVSFHSLASFLMWLKLLYFMRIYKDTGYLVKIISECIFGMRVFLFIYMVVLIAFNEAFTRIDEAFKINPDFPDAGKYQGKNWAQGYAYTFALAAGDTRADNYDFSTAPVIVWIIFILVLLVMNVVMLNLLVAIVSKSFDEINDNWISAMYQERASIISENAYLIPWYRKVEHCPDKDQYLVVTRDLLSEENDAGVVEAVQNKINEIEGSLNDFKKEYRETQEEFADKVTNSLAELISAVKK